MPASYRSIAGTARILRISRQALQQTAARWLWFDRAEAWDTANPFGTLLGMPFLPTAEEVREAWNPR
jgi:hypothetical protein